MTAVSKPAVAAGGARWLLAIVSGLEQINRLLNPTTVAVLQAQYTASLDILAKACQ